MQFADIPFDILLPITAYLDRGDLLSCDLTCKRLHGVTLHHLLRCVTLRYDRTAISSFCALLRREPECVQLVLEFKLATAFIEDDYFSKDMYDSENERRVLALDELLMHPVMCNLVEAVSGMVNLRHASLSHSHRLAKSQEGIFAAFRRCTSLGSLEILHANEGLPRSIYTLLQEIPLVALCISGITYHIPLVDGIEDLVPLLRQWTSTLRELTLHGVVLASAGDVWPVVSTLKLTSCRVPCAHLADMFPNVRHLDFCRVNSHTGTERFALKWRNLSSVCIYELDWAFPEASTCSVNYLRIIEKLPFGHRGSGFTVFINDTNPALLTLEMKSDDALSVFSARVSRQIHLTGLTALELTVYVETYGGSWRQQDPWGVEQDVGAPIEDEFDEFVLMLGKLPSLECLQLGISTEDIHWGDERAVMGDDEAAERAAFCFATIKNLHLLVLRTRGTSWWWAGSLKGDGSMGGCRRLEGPAAGRASLLNFRLLARAYEEDPERYIENTLKQLNL